MQWIIPLHYLLMWYSLMKVKLPRWCRRHLINCQEMAVWNTLYLWHGVIPLSGNDKTVILSLNKKQGLTCLLPTWALVCFGGFWGRYMPACDGTNAAGFYHKSHGDMSDVCFLSALLLFAVAELGERSQPNDLLRTNIPFFTNWQIYAI